MGTETECELASALEAARRPVEHCRMPPAAGLRTRMATSTRLRRLLPTRLMVRRAETRGRGVWARHPEERDRARRAMEAVVGGTEREHEVESLARRHVVETKVRETLFWQPWASPSVEETSTARLREALDSGRGVLLSSCHSGPYLHGVAAVTSLGRTLYSVSVWTH